MAINYDLIFLIGQVYIGAGCVLVAFLLGALAWEHFTGRGPDGEASVPEIPHRERRVGLADRRIRAWPRRA